MLFDPSVRADWAYSDQEEAEEVVSLCNCQRTRQGQKWLCRFMHFICKSIIVLILSGFREVGAMTKG